MVQGSYYEGHVIAALPVLPWHIPASSLGFLFIYRYCVLNMT